VLRGVAPALGLLCIAPLAAAQEPTPDAQAEEPAVEKKPPSRPPSGIEEIVIRGGESDSASDFEAADSVTAFGAEDLAALGAQDIADLAAFTPNLEIVTSGATTPTFFIRGVGLNDFNANSTGAVAIYQDDVALNAPALQLGTLYDIEAVNVLRGPQGTGPARNASAGAIRIYSRKPSGEYGAFLRSELGDYNFRDFEGALEAPVYEDMLSARFAFRYSERDGTMQNRCGSASNPRIQAPLNTQMIALGKTPNDLPWSVCGETVVPGTFSSVPSDLENWVNNLNNWAARGTMLFQPTLDTSFLLSAHGGRRNELSRLGQSYGTNGFYFPNGQTALNDRNSVNGLLGGPQDESVGYQAPEVLARWQELAPCLTPVPGRPSGTCNIAGVQPPAVRLANLNQVNSAKIQTAEELAEGLDSQPWRGDFNRTGPTTNDTWGGYLNGEISLPWGMQFTTVSGYDDYQRLIDIDLDFSPETLFQILTQDEGHQFFQDVQLKGEYGEEAALRWDIGGWFLREHLDVMVDADLDQIITHRKYTQDLWSTAGYANLAFDFWQDFTLEGGFRYNRERKTMDYVLTQSSLPGAFPANPEETWSAPTGTIRLTYRFREDTHAYWKYTRGWKPGSYNATGSLRDPSDPSSGVSTADPETIDAFETGLRGSWLEGRLGLDFSLFYYNYENYQIFTSQQFLGGTPEFVILNAERAEVYGAELDAVVRPWLGAFLNVRFGWLESQFLDFVQQQQAIRNLLNGGFITVTRELDNTGNPLLNSPRFKVSLSAEQTLPLGRYGSLSARYDGTWTDVTYYDATEGRGIPNLDNVQFLPDDTIAQPAFWLHNLRLAYRPPGLGIEIAAWVRNLTNEAYKTFAFDASTFSRTTIYFVGDPRTIGGTLTINF
jgi:outer membrane receptor protein involved in Fe transport